MTLVVEVAPDTERRLRGVAERSGLSLEEHVRALLEGSVKDVGEGGTAPFHEWATPEEWRRAFHEFVESFRRLRAPVIPDEALRRESIYEDRASA